MSSFSAITTKTSTTDILSEQSNHVYILDDTTNVDNSGYVFEINIFDVSNTLLFDPSFETAVQQITGLPDVSAIAVLDVSLTKFEKFFFCN